MRQDDMLMWSTYPTDAMPEECTVQHCTSSPGHRLDQARRAFDVSGHTRDQAQRTHRALHEDLDGHSHLQTNQQYTAMPLSHKGNSGSDTRQ